MNRIFSKLLPLAAILLLPAFAQAQDTASAMRGRVLDESGNPLAGATVQVVDLRTGSGRTFQTNDTGTFLANNLPVGGPYRVTVNGTRSVDVASIGLGDTYNLTINMAEEIEEIIAIGQQDELVETAPGPSATFSFADLDSAVAFNRDIKDVYTIDPRLNLDGFEINCAGKHPRFNSITLDGVSHDDRFGLNTNGYSTATGMPFPYDAIEQVSVELAPFDTNYGGFSACNVNAVTKSGTNEWEVNAFYEYTTQDLIEDKLDGESISSGETYKKTKKGFSGGGPIIKDRLFIFGAYEESEEPRYLAAGPVGFTGGPARPWLSQADFDRLTQIAQNVYGYDPGGTGGNGAQTTENYLVRLDWNISDSHDLALIYNYYDGVQNRNSDGYPNDDPNEFEFANHRYSKGSVSETYTAILRSQWTDSFSTEFFYTDSRMDDSQVTDGPKEFGDHQIQIGLFQNTVYLGADDSRQANSLYTDTQFMKLTAEMLVGDHVFSGGYEMEDLEVFNVFVPQSNGAEWDYRDYSGSNPAACDALGAQGRYEDWLLGTAGIGCYMSAIDAFELGRPWSVDYQNAPGSNNPLDAAALFSNTQHALYVQDEIYFPSSDFTLTAGFRYEWFTSSDTPNYNENLSNALGFRNDTGIDGLSLLMPRLGFTWGVNDTLKLRGGVGLFSGGNPNVWLANAWSNDGIASVFRRGTYTSNGTYDPVLDQWVGRFSVSIFDGTLPTVAGQPVGGAPPQALYDAVANSPTTGSTSGVNLIDPNYDQPGEWKVALGGTWDTPWWGITADIDYMFTTLENGAVYKDVAQSTDSRTSAGAPIYANTTPGVDDILMLTNSKSSGDAQVLSIVLNKDFDWGMDLMLGYAYTDAEDTASMTSFTASSSFYNVATNDMNNIPAATSNYSQKHRLTMRAAFSREFWGDNRTRFTLMGYYGTGQFGTYTMSSDDVLEDEFSSRNLLYVPDGPNDPNVVYDAGFDQTAFFDWIHKHHLKGGSFVQRNSVGTKDSSRFDLKIDQEIPLFVDDLKAQAFLKIYNFTNLLNDSWGRQYDARFDSASVVNLNAIDAQGRYVYGAFTGGNSNITTRQDIPSVWEIRLGLDISFR